MVKGLYLYSSFSSHDDSKTLHFFSWATVNPYKAIYYQADLILWGFWKKSLCFWNAQYVLNFLNCQWEWNQLFTGLNNFIFALYLQICESCEIIVQLQYILSIFQGKSCDPFLHPELVNLVSDTDVL